MTDREDFLAAIKAFPEDDLHRLVFADWLDENSAGDRDTATAKYIRLTCGIVRKGLGKNRAAWTADFWLKNNWRRLVPVLFAEWDRFPCEDKTWFDRRHEIIALIECPDTPADLLERAEREFRETLTTIRTWQRWKTPHRLLAGCPLSIGPKVYVCAVQLWFDRGFVWQASWQAPRLGEKIAAMVAEDQPLAKLNGPGAPSPSVAEEAP